MQKNRIKGFTLMEMMVVVMIIGILAAFAYPTYQNSVDRTYRSDAQAALIAFAALMERRYTENNNYCGNAVLASGTAVGVCPTSTTNADTGPPAFFSLYAPRDAVAGEQGYDLTIATIASTSSFTLQATRANRMVGDECGDFVYSSTGAKTQVNNTEVCW